MKKLLFSALGILGVVGSSLAFKAVSEDVVYCASETPFDNNSDDDDQICNITVTSATLFEILGQAIDTANCSENKLDTPCDTVTVFETGD